MKNLSVKTAEQLDGIATTIITTVLGSVIFALFLMFRDNKVLSIALLIGAIVAILALLFHFISFKTAYESARRADALARREQKGKESPKIESRMHFYRILTEKLNTITHTLVVCLFIFVLAVLAVVIVIIAGDKSI